MRYETRNRNTPVLKVGDVVRCIDDTKTDGRLVEGTTYRVIEVKFDGMDYVLDGVKGSWDRRRFEKVEEQKASYKVLCVSAAGTPSTLTIGKTYEATDAGLSPVLRLPLVEVLSDNGKPQTYYASRFRPLIEDKPKLGPVCKLTAGSCSAQLFVTDGKLLKLPHCSDAIACPHREAPAEQATPQTDLDQLKAILTRSGTTFRTWQVHEYTRIEGVVKGEAIVLVHGAEGDGPYTEYLFDLQGNILPLGATSFYDRGGVCEEAR